MNDDEARNPVQGISAGAIQGTGIVVGHGSQSNVTIGQSLTAEQLRVGELLDNFLRLLECHEDAVADAPGLRESVMEAKRQAQEPSPKWAVVRRLVRAIESSVRRVSALAEAVGPILTLVDRLK
jgi:hypothetical protein